MSRTKSLVFLLSILGLHLVAFQVPLSVVMAHLSAVRQASDRAPMRFLTTWSPKNANRRSSSCFIKLVSLLGRCNAGQSKKRCAVVSEASSHSSH